MLVVIYRRSTDFTILLYFNTHLLLITAVR
jgi:hypothetical protein